MLSDGDFFFDDNFVRHNLSFLLEEEFSDMKNITLSHGNESSIYKDVTAKLECGINTSWSSSSSGSISSVKEEKTKYVNVCLSSKEKTNSLSLDSRFSFDFDIGEARCDNCFTVDFQSDFVTSTPVKNRDSVEQNERIPEGKIRKMRSDIYALAEPINPEDYCNFCRKNGESEYVYSSHKTKLSDGTVSCPILKKYICDLCGSTGENAHTRKYCPLYKKKFQPKATTRRLSNGVVVSCFNHKNDISTPAEPVNNFNVTLEPEDYCNFNNSNNEERKSVESVEKSIY